MESADKTYKIIGAAMSVHSELGCGFLEAVYQEALKMEFIHLQIPYQQQKRLPIYYKANILSKFYIADFVCYDDIIVELKAITETTGINRAQVVNYLKATNYKIALLINFGKINLEYKRFINGTPK